MARQRVNHPVGIGTDSFVGHDPSLPTEVLSALYSALTDQRPLKMSPLLHPLTKSSWQCPKWNLIGEAGSSSCDQTFGPRPSRLLSRITTHANRLDAVGCSPEPGEMPGLVASHLALVQVTCVVVTRQCRPFAGCHSSAPGPSPYTCKAGA